MKKYLAVGAVVVAAVAVYAVSPYFTESTVIEEIPSTLVIDDDARVYGGTFVGVNDGIHNAEGNATAFPKEGGGYLLRLDDFYSTNGPDLYVYMSTDKGISDHISLGPLKANRGSQNYEIPPEVDLEKYDHVLVWCRPFGVLFGSAQISPELAG